MAYCGFVVKVQQLRKHVNADRLQVATFFGNDTIVSIDTKVGDYGIYFPSGGQLSERFCAANDLVRRKDENGKQIGGYLDPDKRNIKAIKLRGEMSDGLYLPITCLADFCKISDLKAGDTIDVVNGEEICCKYIPHVTYGKARNNGSTHRTKVNYAPLFAAHVDTEQLAYNLSAFKPGDEVQLTCKLHGTSARMGNVPVLHTKRTWLDKLLRRHGKDYYEYGDVVGTRRVVLDPKHKGGFYESDDWRQAMADKVRGKLHRGEIIYGEIVGFQGPGGAPIMGSASNKKIQDPEFIKKYGPETVFSYGCDPEGDYEFHSILEPGREFDKYPCCEFYAYRMVLTNEDGFMVEYTPTQLKERCEQMGVKVVPEFETFTIPMDCTDAGEYVLRKVEQYFDGPDPIGKTHVREGVVARILNRTNFAVYKHKNFSFKCLSGIAIDQAETSGATENMSEDLLKEM